jgi:hypothetical protein
LLALAFYDRAFLNRRIINDHDARGTMGRLTQLIKESNNVVTDSRPVLGTPHQFAILAQRAQHIDALSMGLQLNATGLPGARPAELYGRIRAEARFIVIQQLGLPLQRSLV